MSLHDAELQHIEAVLKETRGVIEGPQGAVSYPYWNPNTLRSRIKKLRLVRSGSERAKTTKRESGVRLELRKYHGAPPIISRATPITSG